MTTCARTYDEGPQNSGRLGLWKTRPRASRSSQAAEGAAHDRSQMRWSGDYVSESCIVTSRCCYSPTQVINKSDTSNQHRELPKGLAFIACQAVFEAYVRYIQTLQPHTIRCQVQVPMTYPPSNSSRQERPSPSFIPAQLSPVP